MDEEPGIAPALQAVIDGNGQKVIAQFRRGHCGPRLIHNR